jgi:cyanophycin synthetase
LELSGSKLLTLQMLGAIGLPVGRFVLVAGVDAAMKTAERIGYPIVLKPVAGKKGGDVLAGLQNAGELRAALVKVARQRRQFLLQSFFPGADHRLLVVSGRLIAAARREPASVAGDGKNSVARLVEAANKDPRRGHGFSKLMNLIEIDDEVLRVLSGQGLALDSVPAEGAQVRLRATANISTGGTAVDVTDQVHPDNARAAVKAAKVLDLQVAGVDFISPDISRSWREAGGGICEVNSIVGLRPHWIADPRRDVTGPILETIFPPGKTGRIPTAMITGTKGKSGTTLMLSGILSRAGHCVGTVTTDGVAIGGEMVVHGDVAGINGADAALRDPTVTAAALETARGGLLRSGMYLDYCDVAALLNVGREQIGIDGIDTLDDMARLKRKVLEAARQAIVLNADDERCAAMAGDFPSVRKILFSMQPESSALRRLAGAGDIAIFLKTVDGRETIAVRDGAGESPLLATGDLPSSLGGIVRHNIANAMAAAGLALGLGISREIAAAGLRAYDNSLERTFGRFSFVEGFPM